MDVLTVSLLRQAVEAELRRLADLDASVEEAGGDWPEGYDSSDTPLYELVLEALNEVSRSGTSALELRGKPLMFLLDLIPDWVSLNMARLSPNEYESLKRIYEHQVQLRKVIFPEYAQ